MSVKSRSARTKAWPLHLFPKRVKTLCAIAIELLLRVKASLFLNALAVVNTLPLKATSVSMKSLTGFLII